MVYYFHKLHFAFACIMLFMPIVTTYPIQCDATEACYDKKSMRVIWTVLFILIFLSSIGGNVQGVCQRKTELGEVT